MADPAYTVGMIARDTSFTEPGHTDVCLWLDYYSGLLSERQNEILSLYYNEDWSLAEIAQSTGLSRQGVHDQIRRGLAKLRELELSLELVERDRRLLKLLDLAREQARAGLQGPLDLTLDAMRETLDPGPGKAETKDWQDVTHGTL